MCGIVSLLAFAACGGGSSGGGTTSAAFPTSMGVDVSSVSSEDLQNVNFSVAKAGIPDTGTMSAPITTATNMADLVTKLSDHMFSGIAAALNSQLTSTATQISGTVFGGTLKMDFSNYNYDVDGDGENDPCSGTASITSTQYTCFRAWFNDNRFMIGYLQTAPTADNSGRGIVIASPTLVADATQVDAIGMGNNVMTYLMWDNTVAAENTFNGYMSGQMMEAPGTGTPVDLTIGRIAASSDTTTDKITLRTAAYFGTPQPVTIPNVGEVEVDQVFFNSQFISTGTYLLFENDFLFQGAEVAAAPNNIWFCGVIATGNPAAPGEPQDTRLCEGEGLSATGIEYPSLAATDASKTQFPNTTVFPEAPTF
ncbi:MAG: hypothetical protein ABH859_03355 [Pseudomonadota bacterium]